MTVMSHRVSYMSSSDYEPDEIEDEYEEDEITRADVLETLKFDTQIFKESLQNDRKSMRFFYNNRREPDELAWYLLSEDELQKLYH